MFYPGCQIEDLYGMYRMFSVYGMLYIFSKLSGPYRFDADVLYIITFFQKCIGCLLTNLD